MKDESDNAVKSSPKTKKSDLNSREEDFNEQLLQNQEEEQLNPNVEEELRKSEEKNNEECEETDEKDSSEENKDENIENISSAGGVSVYLFLGKIISSWF